jgi:hypothetical protein
MSDRQADPVNLARAIVFPVAHHIPYSISRRTSTDGRLQTVIANYLNRSRNNCCNYRQMKPCKDYRDVTDRLFTRPPHIADDTPGSSIIARDVTRQHSLNGRAACAMPVCIKYTFTKTAAPRRRAATRLGLRAIPRSCCLRTPECP